MKVFVYQHGGKYLENATSYCWGISAYDGKVYYTDNVEEDAKHFKSKESARSTINSVRKRWVKDGKLLRKDGYKKAIKLLDELNIVEVEVEFPNFLAKYRNKVRFTENKKSYGVTKVKKGRQRQYCKSCGIEMYQIPYLRFGSGPTTICIFCLNEQSQECKILLDNMDAGQRKRIEAARFLERF